MPQLTIIIVSYNSSFFLQLCLDSLSSATKEIETEVIVVDNQSTDDSCLVVKEKYSWVKLIENSDNLGFGKANNVAIRQAKGRHILLLNPDTIVQKQTLVESMSYLDAFDDVGAVGVKMLDGSGVFLPESKRGLPTPLVAFYKAFGLTKLFPHSKHFARYYLGHLSSDEVCDMEVLAGAFIMAKAEVLQSCDGFDEDFFMYGEDIDLSYRIIKKGHRISYLPDSPIIHFKGECAGRNSVWVERFYEAMQLFSRKHFANQGSILNSFVNLGIFFRKKFASNEFQEVPKLYLKSMRLSIMGDEISEARMISLRSQFKEVHTMEELTLEASDAILFGPHVDASLVIETMKKYSGTKCFLFSSSDDSFVLASPKSEYQGEIFQ